VVDVLFWTVVIPPIVLVSWAVLYAGQSLCSRDRPLWLDTPWDLMLIWFIEFHRVTVVDADNHDSIYLPSVRSMRGAVLV